MEPALAAVTTPVRPGASAQACQRVLPRRSHRHHRAYAAMSARVAPYAAGYDLLLPHSSVARARRTCHVAAVAARRPSGHHCHPFITAVARMARDS